jgi:pSer/pThr/pTyr-binding forkhead associated (FHA) protein
MKNQRHVKEYGENVTSYYWKKFECEICKQSYPYIFKRNNILYKLIDIADPAEGSKYILLESMPLDKNTSRNIHMLTVTEKKSEFKLGRGHESEVRINDISVSRCHAIIKCKKDGFYIEDNLSKFGTIVLLKDLVHLQEEHTMAVQVGRSVLSFTIKNIDAREKLKREIAPLLNRTRKEAEAARLQQSLERENSREILEMIEEQSLREQSKNIPVRNHSVGVPHIEPVRRGMSGVGGDRERVVSDVTAISGVSGNQVSQAYFNEMQHMQRRHVPQGGMSNSALVNSGNAAILGHGNLN